MSIHTIPGRHWKFIDSSPNCVKPHPRTGRSLTVIFPTLLPEIYLERGFVRYSSETSIDLRSIA